MERQKSSVGSPPTSLGGGRYVLTRHIAFGGMGEVWAATDAVLGRDVAVKVLRADLVDSPTFVRRFRAEARHTAALAHPGIAGVFDYGEELHDGRRIAYLVMELVTGEPLAQVIAQRGALPVDTALQMLAEAAEALHAAHTAGIVHRDVKPGNLLVLPNGTVKLTDFGIARAADAVRLTEAGQFIGTARYMSPEQASGAEATSASDIYSLGVVGYEMLSGHPPFTSEGSVALAVAHVHQAPEPLPATVPPGVRAVIARAMAKNAADRPSGALGFARELRRLSSASSSSTAVGPATEIMPVDLVAMSARPDHRPWRRWLVLVAAVAAVIALLAVVAHDRNGTTVDPTTTTVAAAPATSPSTVAVESTAVDQPPVPTTTAVEPAPPAHGSGRDNGKPKKDPKP
jgi:eukaryotic-like serine/threonine-protein kinase